MAGGVDIAADGWLRAARYTLIFTGICYLLLIPLAPLIAWSKFNDPSMSHSFNLGFGIGFSVVMLVICVGIAAANFVASRGIRLGKRWGWITGVVLGALYAFSICAPLGAVILYGLLRGNVRKAYLDAAPQRSAT
jgi:hypothetical protein